MGSTRARTSRIRLLALACSLCGTASAASAQLAQTGDLLVADAGADAVFVVDAITGSQSVLASGAPLSDPSGVAVDPTTGLVYVSDRSAGPGNIGALIEIDPADGSMRIVTSGDQLALPEDVIVHGTSGEISVIDGLSGVITIDPTTGAQTVLAPQTGSAITRLALFGAQRSADAVVIDPGPLELRRPICSINPCNLLLVGQGGSLQLPTGITTKGPSPDFAIVSDAGSLLSADGEIIEVRITNFSTVNPAANQRVVASGINLVDPLDLVTDAGGLFVYVVDSAAASGTGAVIRVDTATGDQVVVSSGASFVNPVAIELFPLVNSVRIFPDLYAVDSVAAEVLRVDHIDGSQTTIASAGMLVEPSGVIAVPGTSDLFVTDRRLTAAGAVLRIDTGTGNQTLITEAGNLQNPEDLVRLPGGDLLIADSLALSLIRVDVKTGQQTAIAATPTDLVGITVTGDGSVYGLHMNPPTLSRIDLGGGGVQTVGSGGDLTSPVDVLAETTGSLLVLNSSGSIVRVLPDAYDNSAPASNQVLSASGGELVSPTGFAIAPDEAIYVTDPGGASGAGAVIRLFASGGTQTILSSGGQFVTPADVTSTRPFARPGDILVADGFGVGRIVLVDPISGDQSLVSLRGFLRSPDGITLDLDGSLLVAESQNNLLLRIDLETGAQTIVAAGPDLPDPRAVTVRSDGAIFVGSATSPFPIARVDASSGGTTVIATNSIGENRFSGLKKLITDPASGDLFATTNVVGFNVSGDSLLRLDPDTLPLPIAPQTLVSGLPLASADEMVFDPVSGDVFVANGADILRFDSTGGNASVVSEGGFFDRGFAEFTVGLAMDAQGQLLTTLKFLDAVVRVDPATGAQQIVSFSNLIHLPQGIVVMPVPEPAAALGAIVALLTVAVLKRVRFD